MSSNYLLDRVNSYLIASQADEDDIIYYTEDCPRYLIEYLKSINLKLILTRDPNSIKNLSKINSIPINLFNSWIPRKFLESEDVRKVSYLVNKNNIIYASLTSNCKLLYTHDTDVPKLYLDLINKLGIKVRYIDKNKLPPPYVRKLADITFKNSTKFIDGTKINIIHYLDRKSTSVYSYRRNKLNEYLNNLNEYNVHTIPKIVNNIECREILDNLLENKYQAVVCSDCRGANVFTQLKSLGYKFKLIYDRTDNWMALGDGRYTKDDIELMTIADVVINSSRYLYNVSVNYNKNSYLITNGCTRYQYTNTNKFSKPTAIYIGNHYNKLDINAFELILKTNPNWDVLAYAENEVPTEWISLSNKYSNLKLNSLVPEDECIRIVSKCHIGLIPLEDSQWTAGMLPLKLFNYSNMHIPTLYNNCDECSYYSEVAFKLMDNINFDKFIESVDISDETYDNIVSSNEWIDKFNKIKEFIE